MNSPLATSEPWTLVAAAYDEVIRPAFTDFARRAIAGVGTDGNGRRALDVACGPGTATVLLAEQGYEVDAIDFSDSMLERLHTKLDPDGKLHGALVRPKFMDGQHLQFGDDTFDVALSMFGLMFFPDRACGFGEMHRVLRPGGKACVSSWLPLSQVPLMQWLFGALGAIMPPSDENAPKREPVLEEPAIFREEMEAAGFINVAIERCTVAASVGDIDEFWASMVRSSVPIALLRSNVGEQGWPALNEKALAHLHATAPADLASLSMDAWLGFGEKRSA